MSSPASPPRFREQSDLAHGARARPEHPESGRVFADRLLVARAGLVLVRANARYWLTIAPIVRAQLRRWEPHAEAVRDPFLRALALQKLREERFNVEVAATLATLAPSEHRKQSVEAIVALELMYDYLDGRTEQPSRDPLRNGRDLYRAFTAAVTLDREDRPQSCLRSSDVGYLEALAVTVKRAISQLPGADAIAEVARESAARCAEAQTRIHAAPHIGTAQAEQWAIDEAAGTALGWREFLAGAAASVLSVHALIVAAADGRTTRERAVAIDTVYLSICAVSTVLDSLIDHEHDIDAGEPGYIEHYVEDGEDLARLLAEVVEDAATRARDLPDAAHHLMILAGVVAYYTSAPTASSEPAASVAAHLQRQLRPLIAPTLAVMRGWRLAKRVRHKLLPASSTTASQRL
jgi:tetraprenyl-beta-curcumene synthase